MFCTKCGKQIEENTKFCVYCGAKQVDTSASNVQNTSLQDQNLGNVEQNSGHTEIGSFHCTKCGKQIEENTKFCVYCGAKQRNSSDSNVQNVSSQDQNFSNVEQNLNHTRTNTFYCTNCGKQIEKNTKFCVYCGAKQMNFSSSFERNLQNPSPLPQNVKNTKTVSSSLEMTVSILIVLVVVACVAGGIWFGSTIFPLKKDGIESEPAIEPAIVINDVDFDMYSITYYFENIADKDIAYISFETYFYDRMGGALKLDISSDDYLKLDYTGPLYSGNTDSAYWNYLFEIPSGTAVVFPKKITVTFTDDEKITFENDIYYYTDDFYGGELKD